LQFDVRLFVGSLFSLFGVMLLAWGIASNGAGAARSLGINIDRDWGLVLLLFGASMLAIARRARRNESSRGPTAGP